MKYFFFLLLLAGLCSCKKDGGAGCYECDFDRDGTFSDMGCYTREQWADQAFYDLGGNARDKKQCRKK